MQKQIGFLLGSLCLGVALVNFINFSSILRVNVLGLILIGFTFIESSYFGIYGKIIQIGTIAIVSGSMVLNNDPNSLVPVLSILIAILLSKTYFPNHNANYLVGVPLTISLINDWNIASIINNCFLYVFLAVILHIILFENHKKES